jgi:hypothetical protein
MSIATDAWAECCEVNDRGRVPADIRKAFDASN